MRFALIGTGNVSWHFLRMLRGQGHEAVQIWARDPEKRKAFADEQGILSVDHPENFSDGIDLVLLAVKDDAIEEVNSLVPKKFFVVHPSGSTGMAALLPHRCGVAWSVQSLTRGIETDYSVIPFLIEASDDQGLVFMREIFSGVSKNVFEVNSVQRAHAHMAAVFACNFVNHLYGYAEQILHENNLPMSILLPSIDETARRIHQITSRAAQTGPASRADMKTIERHLDFLRADPKLTEVYRILTASILQLHHGKKL